MCLAGHSRGVLRTINAAETGRPHLGTPILLPSNLTILKVTPGEEIFRVIYDNVETIPVTEPVGFLTQHPHVHHQPHHHRPKDYPSSHHHYRHSHQRGHHQRQPLRQLSSLARSRISPSSRGLQYYYDSQRPRQSSNPIVVTQHPIPAEAVTYPTNSQADPRIYEPTAAPVYHPDNAMRRGPVPHPQPIVAPVYGASPPAAAVGSTRAYVPQEGAVYPSSEVPAAAVPATQYISQPEDASSHLSASSRSSSHSSKRRPVPRRSSQYYYQPRRSRSRPSRSSYSSRRLTSDSLHDHGSEHRHLGVRKTLSRLTDKLMARDGPPSLWGHSSSSLSSGDADRSLASTDLMTDHGSVEDERRAEHGKPSNVPVE